MSGVFGLLNDGNPYHFPSERLTSGAACVDVFALARDGLLTLGASATLRTGSRACPLAAGEGQILIDETRIVVGSHTLGMPLFVCPRCEHDAYRLYEVGGAWACRKCHRLDYACRHRNRTVPGYNRVLYLRRRLGVEIKPFAPLPDYPRSCTRKRALAAEIMTLEARLIGHLRRDVCNVIEQRDEHRIAKRNGSRHRL
jgi:hypothetical protein